MKKLLLLVLIFLSIKASAQYFQTGQDPASIKWRQISTTNFQLIYPDYYENKAQVLAQKLEKIYDIGSRTLHHKPSKISVILHTQTVQSNGLVAYAPKRSEFYTTPHQNTHSQDWLEHLAIHEFRHVVQIDKINSELPKIVKILLGEQGTALVFGAYLPWWYIEGDAVLAETALGNYGRGRFPSFLMEHKAQVVEKGKYSYDKAYLGSFKNYVPNHYQLGYYLVGEARSKYGTDIWSSVLSRVGNKPFSLTPFNKGVKENTGLGKVQLYETIFDSLANEWQNELNNYKSEVRSTALTSSKVYSNYTYNHWINDNEIVSYRTALNKVPAFVKIDIEGNEQRLFTPGFLFDESINYREDWIVWSEKIPDIRWSHSGESLVRMYNVDSGKELSLAPELKAFAPSLSHDLSKVVVVETDFSNNYYLSIYRVGDGQLENRIQTPENYYFFSPEWINETEIAAVVLTPNGKRLCTFNTENGETAVLINTDIGNVKQLKYRENKLYFIGSYTGKNALYYFDFETNETVQVYDARFGVDYPAVNINGNVAVSNYNSDGFQLTALDNLSLKKIEDIEEHKYELAEVLSKQENAKVDFSIQDSSIYESEKYSKANNLFNFHSWAPIFVDPYAYEFYPGVSLMSQNKLGTSETVLGYKWDPAEDEGQFYARYRYKGWFPVFDIQATAGKRASSYWLISEETQNGEVINRDTTLENFSWKEFELSSSVSLPLNFTRGVYYRLLQPEIRYEWQWLNKTSSAPDNFPTGNYHSMQYRLYYHQLMRQSSQDVFPNFGFSLDGTYKHSPASGNEFGKLSALRSNLYLPGVLPNHGIRLFSGIQTKERGETFRYSDIVRFPRGYSKFETEDLATLAVDYKLPLLNPDLSIWGLTYIRRIEASLFYDWSNVKGSFDHNGTTFQFDENFSSYGVEVLGSVNFLRFYAPAKIGVRMSYLNELEEFSFDFLFSIDLTSL